MNRRSFLALLSALLPLKCLARWRKPEREPSNLYGSQIRHTGFRMTMTELSNRQAMEEESVRELRGADVVTYCPLCDANTPHQPAVGNSRFKLLACKICQGWSDGLRRQVAILDAENNGIFLRDFKPLDGERIRFMDEAGAIPMA